MIYNQVEKKVISIIKIKYIIVYDHSSLFTLFIDITHASNKNKNSNCKEVSK